MRAYSPEGWLVGWKHIAKYLDVSVRTAKRWYCNYGVPLFRGPGNRVVGLPALLDGWIIEANRPRKKTRE